MTASAFEAIAAAGDSPLLLLCDHASNRLPPAYGTLGLAAEALQTHIAYDIGAAEVTCALARSYGAAAVLGRWSRLLIDLNRGVDDPTIVMKLSDGSIVPGNRAVDAAEVAHRIATYHAPYHGAVAREIARIQAAGAVPILISIHSFTPSWKNVPRPWQFGILYDRDTRLAKPLMARLAEAGFTVGDNEPYSGALEGDALNIHGTRRGLPHVLIELRQDLIGDDAAAMAFAGRLKPIIDAALFDMGRRR
ncbi:MAG TPA: N-formylglutamate amidohydrolase [Rhizomicrobium sp.]|jgi:predicted N-formylglutamate amidohydrolase|nr:N-formylglutamate amidohydrolase [Rhizomicrobium sp.]